MSDTNHPDNDKIMQNVGLYNSVLIASIRARELKKVKYKMENGALVEALREIETGKIGLEYLKKVKKSY
jgi:hypothetical protein